MERSVEPEQLNQTARDQKELKRVNLFSNKPLRLQLHLVNKSYFTRLCIHLLTYIMILAVKLMKTKLKLIEQRVGVQERARIY